MIVGKLKNIGLYKGLSENLDKAIDSILKGEYKKGNIGKNIVDGEKVFFNVQEIDSTKDIEEAYFETHKRYIDIQIVIDGVENYGVLLSDEGLEVAEPFNYENDFGLFKKSPETIFTLSPEDFIIFFTDEPHMPCLKVNEKKSIKKVVYKIEK
ncbi:MAG: YhcH/YjgK/YiaL family protein [Fusobacterium perfoetens]|uniref:YhcH/YjgK/YiaL family protein n=1 Tax=Fusobacterium perfoetens TaxID=852 RepID=UPI0023F39283|nr:YhcH/YjgK/YiaL family protein [Fusobacterium perfoetens]MCI6151792.1 YhcH/YjgK/YiaL family protein [Fusobacterium perfoetens]MDY3236847.1 YhcH/YjgK/YiaL family protein [Fusobacterium perfoetens]